MGFVENNKKKIWPKYNVRLLSIFRRDASNTTVRVLRHVPYTAAYVARVVLISIDRKYNHVSLSLSRFDERKHRVDGEKSPKIRCHSEIDFLSPVGGRIGTSFINKHRQQWRKSLADTMIAI